MRAAGAAPAAAAVRRVHARMRGSRRDTSASLTHPPAWATGALRVHHAIHALDGFIDLRRALEADGHRIHRAQVHDKLHGGVAVLGFGETPLAAQLHADHSHTLGVNLFGVRGHFVHVADRIHVPLVGRVHAGAVVVDAREQEVQPLVPGDGAQRGQTVDAGAVREDDLLALRLRKPVLQGAIVGLPGRRAQAVQQHDIDVLGLQLAAEVVDLRPRRGARTRCAVLGHQPVALAGQSLESDAEHLRHAAIAFGGFEEADAAVVSVTDQAGESFLAKFALHPAAKRAGAQGDPRDFDIALAEGNPVGGQPLLGLCAEPCEGGSAETCGQKIASGGSIHHPPPWETLYHFRAPAWLGGALLAARMTSFSRKRAVMLCIYNGDAVFDWDDNNLRKIRAHRIKRGDVEQALSNGPILIYEQAVGGEPRFVYYGETDAGQLLAVVLTERDERIRVVTAYRLDAGQKKDHFVRRLRGE